jgi:bifunctional non-homologous end joining protein LigD
VVPTVTPQLLGDVGLRALRNAAAEPTRWAIEPKVDGVRGLVVFDGGRIETRNRQGVARDWLRGDAFEAGLRRLADRLPILWHGTVIDGELTAGQFAGTLAALQGSQRLRPHLRYVAFDVPFLAGADLRRMQWQDRRDRLELLAEAFDSPFELSPLVQPSADLARDVVSGRLEGIVLKDRTSPYRDGARTGWLKVKDEGWYEREAWRFRR